MLLRKPWCLRLTVPQRPPRKFSPLRIPSLHLSTKPSRRQSSVARKGAVQRRDLGLKVENRVVTNDLKKAASSLHKFSEFRNHLLALCRVVCVSCAVACFLGGSGLGHFASVGASAAVESTSGMSAWTGLTAGFLHTLAGPDHLAGLTPLTLGQTQAAAMSMGALWGFGHSSGQLLLGLVFLFLKEKFQGIVPILSKWAGAVVGITLIMIGLMGIYESVFQKDGDEVEPSHETLTVKSGSLTKRSWGTYAMGFIYGLQPDSLFVVLPALTLPTALATLSYVVMFVVGTVCAMAGYTLAIGTASEVAVQNRPWLLKHLSTVAASVALVFGLIILIPSVGFTLPS